MRGEEAMIDWIGYYRMHVSLFGRASLVEQLSQAEANKASWEGRKDEGSFHEAIRAMKRVLSEETKGEEMSSCDEIKRSEEPAKKTYILDTNVLLFSPYALRSFDEHDVVLADVSAEELDRAKSLPGEVGANARTANRILDDLRNQGNLVSGVKLPGGGTFHIETNHTEVDLPESWDTGKADNRILRVAKGTKDSILVSKDIVMRIKADILGIKSEDYKAAQVSDDQYTGRISVYTAKEEIDKFYKEGELSPTKVYITSEDGLGSFQPTLEINQFVTITNEVNPKHTALGRFDGKKIVSLQSAKETPFGVTPRNTGQLFAQECLLRDIEEAPLVILKGPAGTAKTFYSLAAGLQLTLDENKFEKILVTRPNIGCDEEIGFLPGNEDQKIGPTNRSIVDNLSILMKGDPETHRKDGCSMEPWKYLLDNGTITMQALNFMRGRSIFGNFVIVDECQNLTNHQIFTLVTRINQGSKLILCGDVNQIDNPRLDSKTNGLSYISEKMKGSPLCWQVTFNEGECTRSALASEAIERMTPKGMLAK